MGKGVPLTPKKTKKDMGFAVLHINKGSGNGAALGRHNDRLQTVLNADPSRSNLNFKLQPKEIIEPGGIIKKSIALGGERLEDRIKKRSEEGYKGEKAIRKDAVRYLNIVLTGSHAEMKAIEKDPVKLKKWITTNYLFIRDKFSEENIVGFYIHRDEKTPHIHAVVVPLTKDGRLSAKEVMGNKIKLSELQTDYSSAIEKGGFGDTLKRGIKGSKAKHTDINWYYGKVNEAIGNKSLKNDKNKPKGNDFNMGI